MKFVLRFYNNSTRQTERHTFESKTIGQAFRTAMALTMGKDIKDVFMVQEDEQ